MSILDPRIWLACIAALARLLASGQHGSNKMAVIAAALLRLEAEYPAAESTACLSGSPQTD